MAKKCICKKLRRPAAAPSEVTGGAGPAFEITVASLFAVLMVCDGELACFPGWRISSLRFQVNPRGHWLDDILIELENGQGDRRKILGQIKRTVSLTVSDPDFKATIQAAWEDFKIAERDEKADCFALITGPLNRQDNSEFSWLVDQTREQDYESFSEKMKQGCPVSQVKCRLYDTVRRIIEVQNDGLPDERQIFDFLKRFYVLQPDTWYPCGMVESFAITLLKQRYTGICAVSALDSIKSIVSEANPAGGKLTRLDLKGKLEARLSITPRKDDGGAESLLNAQMTDAAQWPIAAVRECKRPDRVALLCLIGVWQASCANDVQVVSGILGINESELDELCQTLSQGELRCLDIDKGVVRVRKRRELWRKLAECLSEKEIERFISHVTIQFKEIDRRLDLEPERRFYSVEESGIGATGLLREGLAQGLALLGAECCYCKRVERSRRENWTRLVIMRCLKAADWRLWATLDDNLPYLAEACPSAYLDCVRHFLRRRKCGLCELFSQERPGLITCGTYIVGFVRALGMLAWMKEHFVSVIELLVAMTVKDLGGQCNPRPASVLRSILHPLGPHTVVDGKRRVAIFSKLVKRQCGDALWKVVLGLLPSEFYSFVVAESWPVYRDVGVVGKVGENIDAEDAWMQFDAYSVLAVQICGSDPDRIVALLRSATEHWRSTPWDALLRHIRKLANRMCDEQRYPIWRALSEVARFARLERKKHNVEAATQREIAICELVDLYEPGEPQFKYRPLFSYTEEHYEEMDSGLPSEEFKVQLAQRKRAALDAVWQRNGTPGVLDFAVATDKSQHIGYLFGETADLKIDKEILPDQLRYERTSRDWVVVGYIQARFARGGWDWVIGTGIGDWPVETRAMFLTSLPFCSEVWGHVKKLLGLDERLYWEHTDAYLFGNEKDLDEAVEGLLSVGRGYSAVNLVAFGASDDNIRVDLSRRVLTTFVRGENEETQTSMVSYHLERLIKAIQKSPEVPINEVAQYEWTFFDLFELNGRNGLHTVALNRQLAENPEFFCEALGIVYGSVTKKCAKEFLSDFCKYSL